jgi:drug/metabolite transporter (DMT)-like permease
MALWGSVFVATKEVLGEAGPFTVAAARFGIGLAVLLPLARREGLGVRLVFSRTYMLFGFTGIFLAYGLQNLALVFTDAGSAALVMAMQPAAVMLMGMLFLRERLPVARLIGIGLAIAGVMMVSGVAFTGGGAGTLLGTALMAGSVLAYGAYAAQGRVLGASRSPSLITAASFATGLLFLLPFVAGEIYLYGAPALGTEGWLVLLYLGVSTTAATFLLWNYALRHLEAGAAGLYFNLIPVTGLGFAVLFGGSVGVLEIAGGTLAISGILVGDYLVRRQRPVYPQAET